MHIHTFVCHMQPEVIWADGAGDSPCTHDSIKYWKAPEFLSWLYNESPVSMTAVVNSRCVMNWAAPVEITVIDGVLTQVGNSCNWGLFYWIRQVRAHTPHTHSRMQLHTMLHFPLSGSPRATWCHTNGRVVSPFKRPRGAMTEL